MIHVIRFLIVPIVLGLIHVGSIVVDFDIWNTLFQWVINEPVNAITWALTLWFLWEVTVFVVRFGYAIVNSKNFVTLKVILPREDSKIDEQKRTEKDFKEKVAIMEQLFRGLHEIRDLTFWTSVHFWIFRFKPISFEMYVHDGLLNFYVVVPKSLTAIVEKQITAYYSNAEVALSETPKFGQNNQEIIGYNMVARKGYMYPIRSYQQMQDDPINNLTNVLSKLRKDEIGAIQMVITPTFSDGWAARTKRMASKAFKGKDITLFDRLPGIFKVLGIFSLIWSEFSSSSGTNAPGASKGDSFVRMVQSEEEVYKQMGEKSQMSGFQTSIRIFASAESTDRAIDITNDLQVAFNVYKDPNGNYFKNKRLFIGILPHALNAPIMHWLWKNRLNGYIHERNILVERELASLYHFPDSRYNRTPIIEWITYKILPPPPDAPTEGILLGLNKYRAVETEIRFMEKDRSRHEYIIGKSGSGKSSLLSWQSRQDIQNGDGVCIIDPHGDLIADALAHTPKERAKDVVVFDPSDTQRPMGLNLLEANSDEEKDRASLDAMQIFIKLFGNEIFGPRIQHYFRNGCLTLMDDEEEGATLIDVPRLFVDEEFQRYKVSKIRNPVVRSFWDNEMAKTGAREKEEMIPYFSSKFGPFITNTTMRNIIGQTESAFNIREIMDQGKVLLVNLSKGRIGDINAQLLGLIFVNKISMAALSRADMPRADRRRFYLYVDEFQNFVTDAFTTILSEARKYELALIMAHQYIGQLVGKTEAYGQGGTKMRDAVFGNVGTILSFKVGAEDAEYLAKEFAPVLSEQDVIGIPNFHAYTKLNINNTTSRPFSLATIYDESERNEELGGLIREYSRMKHGRKKEFVDREIEDRIGIV